MKKIVDNLDSRQTDGDTYEKRVQSAYSIMKATSDISGTDEIAGFSAGFIKSLVQICDSKSPRKEAEFVAAALANCAGTSCKWTP